MKKIALTSLLALAACQSSEPGLTEQDARGNYATTSSYQAGQRYEFSRAIDEGLEDFDRRMMELANAVSTLPADKLDDFQECESDLMRKRLNVENQLKRLEASLDADWPDRRADVADAFDEAREALDEAYEELLD